MVHGELVRNWSLGSDVNILFPYDERNPLVDDPSIHKFLWCFRTTLFSRPDFSRRTYKECGRPYWEYHQIPVERNLTRFCYTVWEVATHNHFCLDNGGKVFKNTLQAITLPTGTDRNKHLSIIGVLNSSIAVFWLKQICQTRAVLLINRELAKGLPLRRFLSVQWNEGWNGAGSE